MAIDFERAPVWRRYLRFWGSDAAGDVDAELRFHLESRVAELVGEGWDEESARRAAAARFGDVERIRRHCRELREEQERSMRRSEWFSEIWQDLRYGWRTLVHAKAFTLVAVLSLAVGIGANTAIFGLLHKVILERLHVERPERLVQLSRLVPEMGGRVSEALREDQLAAIRDLRGIEFTTFGGAAAPVTVGNERSDMEVDGVAGSFFSVVDVRPLLGRLITAEDDLNRAPVVVISEAIWQHYFAGDRAALGKTIRIRETPFTIIGVTPASYRGVMAFGSFDLAIPESTLDQVRPARGGRRGPPMHVVIGRLADGVRAEALEPIVQARLANCCDNSGAKGGEGQDRAVKGGKSAPAMKGPPAAVGKGAPEGALRREPFLLSEMSRGMIGKFDPRARYGGLLYALMGGVVVLLLVACANVGTLLLARAETRRQELAVRYSLGAVRIRLIRQLLTESLLLAVLGAVLGYLLSRWGLKLLATRMEQGVITDFMSQSPDGIVLAFTTSVTLLSTILFGVLPARRATQVDVVAELKEGGQRLGGRRSSVLDYTLIVVQVALALLLVTTSGLLVQTLHNLRTFDAGFESVNLLMVRADFGKDRPTWASMTDDDIALERMQQLPGVQSAALTSTAPVVGGSIWMSTIDVTGYTPAASEDVTIRMVAVTADYFRTAGIALRAGRTFSAGDHSGTEPVCVVSETFARRFLGGRPPSGEVVQLGGSNCRIVGVVGDARYANLREPERPLLYLPATQFAGGTSAPLVLVLRTTRDARALTDLVQRELRAGLAQVNIRSVVTMTEAVNRALSRERMAAILGTLFGVLALALAALGLYGLIAYQVAGRTREIGTRMALGARGSRVVWLILRQSVMLLGLGFALGIPLALAAARAVSTQLFGVRSFDPLSLGGAVLVLTIAGALASLLPARRATRVDPLTALRA
jgi:putative ABC transport system permease protein